MLVHAHHAKTRWERFKGLMGIPSKELDYPLVFHLEREGIMEGSIHMLFMKTPIDVVWLDAQQRVVDWKENIPPWSLNHSPSRPAAYIIEFPPGTIHSARPYSLKPGDRVFWKK